MPDARTTCDLAVVNGYVITMDDSRNVLSDGGVAISDGRIVAVGTSTEINAKFEAARTIDAKGGVVRPGSVEAHTHVSNHLTRGAFGDEPGIDAYFVNYAKWMNAMSPEDEHASVLLASLEMLQNGITCFMDGGTVFDADAAAGAAERIGIRASIGPCYLWDVEDSPRFHSLDQAPSSLDRAIGLLDQQLYRNSDPDALVRGHVAIFGAGTGSDELIIAAKQVADANNAIFTQQQCFEADDVAHDVARFGAPSMIHYRDIGVLGPNCQFAILNGIVEEEIDPIVESGISVSWNPGNFMYYGLGSNYRSLMPELFRRGVPVGLATDVAKVWGYGEQGYIGYLLAREYGDYLSPEDILTMATRHGARCVGVDTWAGSLEAGKWADVVVENSSPAEMHPRNSVIRNTALTARTKSVETVVVAGRVVLEAGEPVLVSREQVYGAASAAVQNITGRSDFNAGERWPVLTGAQ